MIQWHRHLQEYRSDKGYTVSNAGRGSMWSLWDGARIVGRYHKLVDAKAAAEHQELMKQKQELGVGRNGHETFDSLWGSFDVTVANQLAEERGQESTVPVNDCAKLLQTTVRNPDGSMSITMGVSTEPERVEAADLSYPITVATLVTRGGKEAHAVIDGWHRIAKAKREGVETLPCRILSQPDTELVRL